MAESAYTKGPWAAKGMVKPVADGEGEKIDLFCGNVEPADRAGWRGDICMIQSADHINGISREEAGANARLIAAAPDLVEALKSALSAANEMEISSAYFPRVEIEAALSRALGKEG